MSDDTEDGPEKKVKKAMAAKKTPPKLTIAAGGKGNTAKPSKRPGKGSAPPPDDGEVPPHDEVPDGPDGFDDGEDGGGRDLTPEEGEVLRGCARLDQNDRDNARRLDAWYGENLGYVRGMGWLTWRGTHWQRDEGELDARLMAMHIVDWIKREPLAMEPSEGQKRLLAAADAAATKPFDKRTEADFKLIAKGESARKALGAKRSKRVAFAVTTGNAGRTGAMLMQAASLKALEQERLDADRMRFNIRNGTLRFWREADPDSETGSKVARFELLPHDRADHITKVGDVDYVPGAGCPEFQKFLDKVMPDKRMQLFLQVFHAYALLIGGNDEQKLVYHYGTGANGKSIFIEVLGRLSGSYRTVVSPETITGDGQRGGQQASPDIARLHNTRLTTIEELPRNAPLREDLIKAVSGGTKMTARFLQKEIFEFEPQFTAVLTGNSKPSIQGSDYGIWRRVLLVLWGVTIAPGERVPPAALNARLDAERPGILNWLIDGIMLYLERGLDPFIPAEVADFTQDYREERDNVGVFAEKCIVADPGHAEQAGPLFKHYVDWCERNGLTAAKQRTFGDRLNELGFKKARERLYMYLDIRVDTSWKFDPASGPPPRDPDDPGM
ncbi:MAG TPA: phage/plasmid primase, P4 family [Bradyrhizobium sp.]|nr:phage/plasmid primase, P4 family [Bradyrhizobium sp.]